MQDKIAFWSKLPKKQNSFEGSFLFDNEIQMVNSEFFDPTNVNIKKGTIPTIVAKVPCILYAAESAGKIVGYWCRVVVDKNNITMINKTNVNFESKKFPKDMDVDLLSSTDGYVTIDMFDLNEIDEEDTFAKQVTAVCNEIRDLLIEKNKSYGNSALEPVHCFYKGSTLDSIKVRIDDKLSRLMRGSEYIGDDTVKDLLGYLVLYRVAEKNQNSK